MSAPLLCPPRPTSSLGRAGRQRLVGGRVAALSVGVRACAQLRLGRIPGGGWVCLPAELGSRSDRLGTSPRGTPGNSTLCGGQVQAAFTKSRNPDELLDTCSQGGRQMGRRHTRKVLSAALPVGRTLQLCATTLLGVISPRRPINFCQVWPKRIILQRSWPASAKSCQRRADSPRCEFVRHRPQANLHGPGAVLGPLTPNTS